MSTTFERLFGPPPPHPASTHSAGLSTAHHALARDRWSPIKNSNTHAPQGNSYANEHQHSRYPAEFQTRSRPYKDFSLSASLPGRIGVADISGASPSRRPIYATSQTPHQAIGRTGRFVDPLQPTYTLPGASSRPCTSFDSDASRASGMSPSRRPMSSSLDCSDISGAQPRGARFVSPERRLHSSIDYRDVPGTRPRPFSRTSHVVPVCSMTVDGISRASPWSRTGREVLSPGRGTLHNDDIAGSRPGPRSGAEGLPSTWGLGRNPLPSVPRLRFGNQARQTVYERPPMYSLGED